MTPDQLAKSGSEHGEQRALFAFVNVAKRHGFATAWAWADSGDMTVFQSSPYAEANVEQVPELDRLFAIPNGGSRGDDAKSRAIRGGQLKAEGVKPGVPDVFFPLTTPRFAGLFIEMKRSASKATKRRAGSTSGEQDDWIAYLRRASYAVSVCFDWRSAAKEVQQYVELYRGS